MLSLDAFSRAQSNKRLWRPGSTRTRWRSFPSDSLVAIGGGILLLNGRERRGERGEGREGSPSLPSPLSGTGSGLPVLYLTFGCGHANSAVARGIGDNERVGCRHTYDCVTVRSMVNIGRLTIWSIYCSRGGGEGRADPLIVAPFIGAA